jgi:hypothetical protein
MKNSFIEINDFELSNVALSRCVVPMVVTNISENMTATLNMKVIHSS